MYKSDMLFTDHFLLLSYLYNLRDFDNRATITQQELAEHLELSRATVNRIISDLKLADYLRADGRHLGRYIITKEAIRIVTIIKSIEDEDMV